MSVRLRRFDLGEFGKDDPRTQLMNNEREDGEVDEGKRKGGEKGRKGENQRKRERNNKLNMLQ